MGQRTTENYVETQAHLTTKIDHSWNIENRGLKRLTR